MNRFFGVFSAVLALLAAGTFSASGDTAVSTTTTVVVTQTRVETKQVEERKWSPLRVAVLDFVTIDAKGSGKFLDGKNKPIEIPAQCTLNAADRKSINSVMQGFVRLIDAFDSSKTGDANRDAQQNDNRFNRAKALDLYKRSVDGAARPAVIGADYLTAHLGKNAEVFQCFDASLVSAAMEKLSRDPDFPNDCQRKLARATGLTHLIYGTVSDLRSRERSFKGYGIETKTTEYQLDLLVKVVDLAGGKICYSNVYTGSCRIKQLPASGEIDGNLFQTLMTSAVKQAAEDLADAAKPGRNNKISATPMPYTVKIVPEGGFFFKPDSTGIYVDGVLAGNGAAPITIPAGKHRFEVRAAGYRPAAFDYDVTQDAELKIKLEK